MAVGTDTSTFRILTRPTMSAAFFRRLHARFDASSVRGLFVPRKPRNALLRVALGLVGIVVLAALLVVGLVVGTAMVAFGLLRAALRSPKARDPRRADALDGDYRVVQKPGQPLLR